MDTVQIAKNVRLDILKMINRSHASHIASAFSIVDIVSVLYSKIMQYNKDSYNKVDRDKFILSKGHAGSAIYAVLYELGILSETDIQSYYQNGSSLSGHISHKNVPGVEFSTGSLGHGICVACGIAFEKKLAKKAGRVFTLIGDGECDEGSVWETAMFAAHHKLDNYCVIVDRNKLQALGKCKDIICIDNLSECWKSFGWEVYQIDGHNHEQIYDVLAKEPKNKPKCIIAETVKGKGVSFMEDDLLWHYRDPQGDYFSKALEELQK